MAGQNLDYANKPALMREVFSLLTRRVGGGGVRRIAVASVDPTPNSANNEPNKVHDVVLALNEGGAGPRVWICTSHSGPTSHTWTRIDG